MCHPFSSGDTVGAAPIRVVRVVVVDVAARVDVPRIVRVATIRRPQAHILRLTYTLIVRGLASFYLSRAMT